MMDGLGFGARVRNAAGITFELTGERDREGRYRAIVIEAPRRSRRPGRLIGEAVFVDPADVAAGKYQVLE